MPQIICKVCQETQSKYKCPACLIPYCSLGCFKKHQEIPCLKQPKPSLKESEREKEKERFTPADELRDERPYYVEDFSQVLQQLQLETVASSKEIREGLINEDFQKLLYTINFSKDPESEIDKAMQDDSFRIFTEKILSLVNDNPTSS